MPRKETMHLFLSDRYTKPTVLIRDPRELEEELCDAEGALDALEDTLSSLAYGEKRRETEKETAREAAERLYLRIEEAIAEYDELVAAYEERLFALENALAALGIRREGRFFS